MPPGGRTCRQAFEAALALEFENPAVFGRVHHLTVTCYNLQHPHQFTPEALKLMNKGLRALVAGEIQPGDLRAAMGRTFSGSRKVLRQDPTPPRLHPWRLTTADLALDSGPEAFIASVRRWASSIVEELENEG